MKAMFCVLTAITATNMAGMTDTFIAIISLIQTPKAPVFRPNFGSASLNEGQVLATLLMCVYVYVCVRVCVRVYVCVYFEMQTCAN